MGTLKVVKVLWIDACSYVLHGWMPKEDSDDENFSLIQNTTVGMLYLENDDRIVVILNENTFDISQAQAIPKVCIMSMQVLQEGE